MKAISGRCWPTSLCKKVMSDSNIRDLIKPPRRRRQAADGPSQRTFQAILDCLLGEDTTTPRLVEIAITPDGPV